MKESPKAAGVGEIFVAGEIENRKQKISQAEGVNISDAVIRELREVSEMSGIPDLMCELLKRYGHKTAADLSKERKPRQFLNFRQVPEKTVQWYRGNIDISGKIFFR